MRCDLFLLLMYIFHFDVCAIALVKTSSKVPFIAMQMNVFFLSSSSSSLYLFFILSYESAANFMQMNNFFLSFVLSKSFIKVNCIQFCWPDGTVAK